MPLSIFVLLFSAFNQDLDEKRRDWLSNIKLHMRTYEVIPGPYYDADATMAVPYHTGFTFYFL